MPPPRWRYSCAITLQIVDIQAHYACPPVPLSLIYLPDDALCGPVGNLHQPVVDLGSACRIERVGVQVERARLISRLKYVRNVEE
ncbi:hypothetical protein HYQ46_007100 [Verticillium longisporum]|nr:hypothetical protein HYQ46_007100 [Verticillium longisporum]